MIKIEDKASCCGCTACASICPRNCITMKPDFEGFLYPEVDSGSCINCGLCERICPIANKCEEDDSRVKSYVLRTRKSDVLMDSTSGGFITPLAEWVFEQKGVICGAVYKEDFTVNHQILIGGVFFASRFKICAEQLE